MSRKSVIEILPEGIRKRDNRYVADVSLNGKKKQVSSTTLEECLDKRDAVLRQMKREQKKEEDNPNGSWSLEYAYKKTVELIWQHKPSLKTNTINSIAAINFFGKRTPVSMIDLDAVDTYVDHLYKLGNTGSTINKKLSALSRILRTAHDRGKLSKLIKMPRQPENEHRIRTLSDTEEHLLVDYYTRHGYEDYLDACLILLYSGLRCSELWRLGCEQISLSDLDGLGLLSVWKTKNGKPRFVPITPKLRPTIIKRMKKVGHKGLLFPGWNNAVLRWGWGKMRSALGMDDDEQFTPHMLRHTCATRLARKGNRVTDIKDWMGHDSIETTMIYINMVPHDLCSAARSLSDDETPKAVKEMAKAADLLNQLKQLASEDSTEALKLLEALAHTLPQTDEEEDEREEAIQLSHTLDSFRSRHIPA